MGRALKRSLKQRSRRHPGLFSRLHRVSSRWLNPLPWKTSQARCVGTSHLDTGSPCQDQVDSKLYQNGVLVVALSDGAGSAAYSHYGAFIAVHRSMDLVSEHFDEAFGCEKDRSDFKRRLVAALLRDLNETATVGINLTEEERVSNGEPSCAEALLVPCSVKELSCTLLLVAIRNNKFLLLHVGDGVIGAEVAVQKRRRLVVLSKPSNGEFANETSFLTSGDADRVMRMITGRLDSESKRYLGFILMSDGPETTLYKKANNALAPACIKLFDANRELDGETMEDRLYSTLKVVVQRKTSDDCSIAIATRGLG